MAHANKTHIDENLCKNCKVVENEFHFLFECCLFNDLRIQYMQSYFYSNPSHFKLKHLFQVTSEKQLTDLAIYIYKVFTLKYALYY